MRVKGNIYRSKEKGSAMELVSFGLVLLGFASIMVVYLGCVELVEYKTKVSQVARKYILRMESVGYLESEARNDLLEELQQIGIIAVDLTGTTLGQVSYGGEIVLSIKGQVVGRFGSGREGLYQIREVRASTAKH